MEQGPESNTDITRLDIFTAVNNYMLLFFGASCVVSSMYVQQLFITFGQYRMGISASAALGIILPLYFVVSRFAPGVRRQLRVAPPRGVQLLYVLVSTLATVVIVDQIYLITQSFSPVPEHYTESLKELKPTGAGAFVATFLGLSLMVPIAEEVLFRGFIQQIFARNMGGVVGFVLAGLLFGAVHLNVHLLVSITFFGVFLGFIYYATGNLVYTIIAHSVFNTVALLQLTLAPSPETTELPFYLRDVRIFVVSLVLVIYLLYKIKSGGPETEPPWKTDL